MDGMTTFTSDKESLQEILKAVAAGKYQLPEFQRGWIWDDAHITSLLASISLSYPIGAVMMLENGNPDVKFKPRPVEGVELANNVEPDRFILDGQQRLTSLYQSLFLRQAVKTQDIRKKEIHRWYYIDMRKALDFNGDREDAIRSIPKDKKVINFRNEVIEDFSTCELEYESMLFPITQVFDCADWRAGYNAHWNYDPGKTKLFDQFERNVIKRFEQYQVPVIKLLKETPKIAVCQVFEKVNTGGVSLTVFELVTASFAAEGFNLREDWEGKFNERGQKIGEGRKDILHKERVLQSVGADEVLQVISLLTTYARKQAEPEVAISCKRNEILKLKLRDYTAQVELAVKGFQKAARFLFQQKIFSNKDIPYTTQVVPLAAIFAVLDRELNDLGRQKLTRWYWCGVFGELYGSALETRFSKDMPEVLAWFDGEREPDTVTESNFVPNRLETLRSRNSAAYKGLYALLMRDGGLDFRTGVPIDVQTYFNEWMDIHHIFPKGWCEKNGVHRSRYNSIINKTALSYQTNRIIGGSAPSAYLKRLREKEKILPGRQDEILASHIIDTVAMKADDFDAFFEARKESLLQRIERATGKTITREPQAPATTGNDDSDDFEMENEEELQA